MKTEIDSIAKKYGILSYFISTTSHVSGNEYYSKVVTLDADPEAVDLYIINHMEKNDVIITQDNGLAAVVLEKGGHVVSPRGNVYNRADIQQLLLGRFTGLEIKRKKIKPRNTKPFRRQDRENFSHALEKLLSENEQWRR
ncbi:DUF188 domain-containing protein [Alteribacillus iranensis]|uniref:Uncharacterized protein n=1 Tax=Alteribacillus iranensis TaxID=930128 RepID=A0A1I1ZBT5_9BACI|nr:DUF188 domain-containing protein [Alteribacillus iranensis]SFE29196.1 hypothetical protein SAMN05192532_101154 [Alteribacillus iranensis]